MAEIRFWKNRIFFRKIRLFPVPGQYRDRPPDSPWVTPGRSYTNLLYYICINWETTNNIYIYIICYFAYAIMEYFAIILQFAADYWFILSFNIFDDFWWFLRCFWRRKDCVYYQAYMPIYWRRCRKTEKDIKIFLLI